MIDRRLARASDRERDTSAEFPCDAYAMGFPDTGAFEDRIERAFAARTKGELIAGAARTRIAMPLTSCPGGAHPYRRGIR